MTPALDAARRSHLHLACGAILFAFAALHLANHAIGVFDLETMHAVQRVRTGLTRSILVWPILAAALLVHMALGLHKLATRFTWRLPAWELAQVALGVTIPFLLLPHIIDTRLARSAFGVDDGYLYTLARLWPSSAGSQVLLVLVVWGHGCLGLHMWLKFKPWYRRWAPLLLGLAVALPVLAVAGFAVAGRSVAALAGDPKGLAEIKSLTRWPDGGTEASLARWRTSSVSLFLLALLGVLAWSGRHMARKAAGAGALEVSYFEGPQVRFAAGPTLLEISRSAGVAHSAQCGGRGRCTTCRVRVDTGLETLPPPAPIEAAALARIEAPAQVRLACQVRPTAPIAVTRLVAAGPSPAVASREEEPDAAGAERPLAILYVDMRDFNAITQNRLPYDTVFLLNDFLATAVGAIESNGGWVVKVAGDSVLAAFGYRSGLETGCREALMAARALDLALDAVNGRLQAEIGRSIDVAMGAHAGPVIVGRIGVGREAGLSVIGSTVNVARYLETLAKQGASQLLITRELARLAGWESTLKAGPKLKPKGLDVAIEPLLVTRGREIPVDLGPLSSAAAAADG